MADSSEAAGAPAPAISVVIPTLAPTVLDRVLDAFARQTTGPGAFEVIVVADAAEPDPGALDAVLAGRPYRVRRLTAGRPGASANRNAGWRAARAPLILFCDDDTIPVPGFLAAHLDGHERHPQAEVAVTGLVRWSSEMPITPFMRWLEMGFHFDYRAQRDGEVPWPQLYTANCSLKRSFVQRLGGFDEVNLPFLYEDTEFALRALGLGLRVMLETRAVVHHLRTATVEEFRRRGVGVARGEWATVRLHPGFRPWFYERFTEAMSWGDAPRWPQRLARVVPFRAPLIGRAVWHRAHARWLQDLAPEFLAEWERLAAQDAQPARSSAGSPPGGPK